MADRNQRLESATVKAEAGINILYRFANDAEAAAAIPTDSGEIKNLKRLIAEIQEDGTEKISIATTIYQSVVAGLAATADGGIYLVQSSEADEIYSVWKNDASTAVNTGKTAMSSQAIQDALTASNEAAQAAEGAADVAVTRTAAFLQPTAEVPVLRDNGLPLQEGDRYFNTDDQAEYLYKDAGWVANDSIKAVADLRNDADPKKGASEVGWDKSNVGAQLDLSKKLFDYSELRAYSGSARRIEITKDGISGKFNRLNSAADRSDDGGETIISVDGVVWQREYSSILSLSIFGSQGDAGATNNREAIANAIAASSGRIIYVPMDGFGGQYAVTAGAVVIPAGQRFEYEAEARIYTAGGTITGKGRHFSLLGAGNSGAAASASRGFDLELGDNTGAHTNSTLAMNRIQIMDDSISGNKVDGLYVFHRFGGAEAKGGRHAIEATLLQADATAQDNPDRNYASLATSTLIQSGDGGSDDNPRGAYFGANMVAKNLGARNLYNLTACEFNTTTIDLGGREVLIHTGFQLASHHNKRGTIVDTAMFVSSRSGSLATFASGIRFDNQNGAYPLGSDSKILVCRTESGDLQSFAEIPRCTGAIISSGDVSLQNAKLKMSAAGSNLELGSQTKAGTPYTDWHSSGTSNDYDVRASISGGSATAGSGTYALDCLEFSLSGTFRPLADNVRALGRADKRFTQLFAATSTINTSDERLKQQVSEIDDLVLDAWSSVEFVKYKFNDSVELKGGAARWHFGVIAQRVKEAFEAYGLDPFAFGILCHDSWDGQDEIIESWKDEVDAEGNVTRKAGCVVAQEFRIAGDRYGIRYEEALALESALMRRTTRRLEKRLEALESAR